MVVLTMASSSKIAFKKVGIKHKLAILSIDIGIKIIKLLSKSDKYSINGTV